MGCSNFPDGQKIITIDSNDIIFLEKLKMIIRAITNNNGKTIDRYSVYFYDGSCLTLSSNPDSPQGVSQWGEYFGINDSHFEEAAENKNHIIPGTDEQMINFFELPVIIQAHVEKRIIESK
ncbi:hypothetical protein ACFL3G_13535 [Planctomycetota bacterium]